MTTKVKGLFKGLKNNITNIFEEKEDGEEIQIGFPTDVKHVAHIGLDSPSANTPTCMTTMNSSASEAPELSAAAAAGVNSSEIPQGNSNNMKGEAIRSIKEIPRSKPAKDTSLNSPTRRGSDEQKHVRRHRHTNTDPSSDSSTRGSSRTSRRHRSTNQARELSSEDMAAEAAAPKQHRRRKSKTSNGDGSMKSSRRSSKGNSLTEISFTDLEPGDGAKRCESLV
ncbi:CRIB domain-containing protein RIC10-like [Prosopis cineraria]|uniref:CRIB domain-containing protein RIC10-like n=1 Tax=Prosopis cineraria TaxID=364024 RepID=UPI0024100F1C|nr:CRIB domain-containing protein RIC10-like [Prosopis cineraria]